VESICAVERLQNDAKKICGCCAAVASEVKSVESICAVERLQNDAKKICGCCAAVASEVKSVERKVFLD
jgi:hypothetical protein